MEYDLGFLLNLIETKMTLKPGVELEPTDIYIIKKNQDRISDKKENINLTADVLNNYIDFEHDKQNSIHKRINELETKIERLISNSKSEITKKLLLGFSEVSIERDEMFRRMRTILEKTRVNVIIVVPSVIDLHYFKLDKNWVPAEINIACYYNPELPLHKEFYDRCF